MYKSDVNNSEERILTQITKALTVFGGGCTAERGCLGPVVGDDPVRLAYMNVTTKGLRNGNKNGKQ